eukprot:scaffold47288_cov25-Tisochrysis_lutea.AAC.2
MLAERIGADLVDSACCPPARLDQAIQSGTSLVSLCLDGSPLLICLSLHRGGPARRCPHPQPLPPLTSLTAEDPKAIVLVDCASLPPLPSRRSPYKMRGALLWLTAHPSHLPPLPSLRSP